MKFSLKSILEWMKSNSKEYDGKWLAFLDSKLIDFDESRIALQKRIETRPDIRNIFVVEMRNFNE